jgi:hypothetical protein
MELAQLTFQLKYLTAASKRFRGTQISKPDEEHLHLSSRRCENYLAQTASSCYSRQNMASSIVKQTCRLLHVRSGADSTPRARAFETQLTVPSTRGIK